MNATTGSPDFDLLWDFRDPAASEARFAEACGAARAACNVDQEAALLTQLARARGLQRRFAEAHATMDEAEALQSRCSSGARIRMHLERGRLFNSAGDPAAARPLFLLAFDDAHREGAEALAVDAAHMVAIASSPPEAIEWTSRALAMAEASTDPKARKWRASLNNNLGWSHHERGDFATALVHFERAVAQRREQANVVELRVARWCVARTLRSLGQVETALSAQRSLEAEHAAAGTSDGFVQEEIGECLLALGRSEEAAPHFAQAHALLSADPWLGPQASARLERLLALSSSRSRT